MAADSTRASVEIAARARALRTERRWTLDELAARSSVSRRLLVQIERGDANPSLSTLLKLAAALDVTLAELVSAEPEAQPATVVPATEAMTLWSTPTGSAARLLVSHEAVELWSWTLAPGDRRASDAHRSGSVELLTVGTGTVALDVGVHHVEVPAGDSAWFDATLPHAYANPGTTDALFTLVVFEPA